MQKKKKCNVCNNIYIESKILCPKCNSTIYECKVYSFKSGYKENVDQLGYINCKVIVTAKRFIVIDDGTTISSYGAFSFIERIIIFVIYKFSKNVLLLDIPIADIVNIKSYGNSYKVQMNSQFQTIVETCRDDKFIFRCFSERDLERVNRIIFMDCQH